MAARPHADRRAALLLAALAMLAAGCSDRRPPDTGEAPAAQPPAVQPFVLSDCTGWFAVQQRAAGATGGERPAGWATSPPGSLASVRLDAYRCQRLSFGPFERGPVHLLLESHTDAAVPASCTAGAGLPNARSAVATGAWTDDAEVAAYLRENDGLPVTVAAVREAAQAPGGAARSWEWQAEGQPASALSFVEGGPPARDPSALRLFWPHGAGLAALELALDDDAPSAPLPATGTLQPPHLLGRDTAGRFTGFGTWLPHREAAGALTHFADTLCSEAAS